MRIDEIASAEDQIALFKLITDKVWQALGDQQRAEAETKAAQPLKSKLKPTAKPVVKPMSFKTSLAKPAQPKTQNLKNSKAQHQNHAAKQKPQTTTPFSSAKQSSSTNTSFDSKPQILDADSDIKKKELNDKDRYS